MKRLTVLVAAALTLVACAPDSGTVTDKSYHAPYSSWTAGYYSSGSCYSYNKQDWLRHWGTIDCSGCGANHDGIEWYSANDHARKCHQIP